MACLIITADADACGPDTDCEIGIRGYRIAQPSQGKPSSESGAILFVHGYRSSAGKVMGNRSLTALADDLGVAFVAADANGPEWNLPGVPSDDAQQGVDELEYFDALADDLEYRFGIRRSRTLVTGFSSGAMMVWYLACHRGDAFAGYAPMSGTFWAPVPDACPGGPVNLIHYHGTEDPVVPLAGQPIKDARQGDVPEAMAMMARSSDYRAVETPNPVSLDCDREVDGQGRIMELCLFDGKHELRTEHIKRTWRELLGRTEQ